MAANDTHTNGEDEPRTLIFVDMLGFAAFTVAHPTRTRAYGPDNCSYSSSETTPLQSRIIRFQHVLDVMAREQTLNGGVSAMIFSDCAYIDVGTPLRASVVATWLMTTFIQAGIPVRMGIGRGTFYGFKYSTELVGADMITKSLFAGTAVVNAYSAERCGAKGCRVLIHPSAEESLTQAARPVRILALPTETPNAKFELCYLTQEPLNVRMDPKYGRVRWVDEDLRLVESIQRMAAESEPTTEVVRFQYSETLRAVDRMREALERPISLEYAEVAEAESVNEENAIADDEGD